MNRYTDSTAAISTSTPFPREWDNFYSHKLKIRTYDHVLGWIFIIGTVVGVLGNSSAICFFWPRRKKTIHDMLYLLISAVDLVTVSLSFPLIASLLNDRHYLLFGNEKFCEMWILTVVLSIRMSIFLAMVICVTRTMILKYPKRLINGSLIISVIIGYFVFLVLVDVIYVLNKWVYLGFSHHFSSCGIIFSRETKYARLMGTILQVITLFAPSFIIFICFIVGMRILLTRPAVSSKTRKGFHKVSITISIFTAIFLLFNSPYVVRSIWSLASFFGLKGPYETFSSKDKPYEFLH